MLLFIHKYTIILWTRHHERQYGEKISMRNKNYGYNSKYKREQVTSKVL